MEQIVYIGGTFDLFHAGHVAFLFQVKKHLDFNCRIVLALNSDAFAESYKRLPILNEQERLTVVKSCKHVDEVFIMEAFADQPGHIQRVHPNYIAHGDDWTGPDLLKQLGISQQILESISFPDGSHCEMLYVPYTPTISSSQIMQRVLERDSS